MKKIISALCITTIFINLNACGTILHPERNTNQSSTKVDMGILLLDGVGLLFFLIPGIVAYAVDFNTGAIYLPRGSVSRIDDMNVKNMVAINVGKKNLTSEKINIIISKNTGLNINDKHAQIYKIDNQGKKVLIALK